MSRLLELVNYNVNLCEPTRVVVSRTGWLGASRNQYPSISFSFKLQGCVAELSKMCVATGAASDPNFLLFFRGLWR